MDERESRILIVDDNKDIHEDIKNILSPAQAKYKDSEVQSLRDDLFGDEGDEQVPDSSLLSIQYKIDDAYQGEEAVKLVQEAEKEGYPYSLIFMDVRIPPGMDGIQTIGKVWEINPCIEVVICTAYSDYSWDQILAKFGQNDHLLFLKKPFDSVSIKQITLSLTTKWQLGIINKDYVVSLEAEVKKRTQKLLSLVDQLSKEIALRKEKEKQLVYTANYDSLTGLINRFMLEEKLSVELEIAKKEDKRGALIFFDLDNFTLINNTLGYSYGDKLIHKVGNMLKELAGDKITVSRLGGDKFILLYGHENEMEELDSFNEEIMNLFNNPVQVDENKFHVTVSLGISIFPDDGETGDELIKNAESAVCTAKVLGKNCFMYFESAMNNTLLEKVKMGANLREALVNNEFALHYQPQIDIGTNRICGLEALIRWSSPYHGSVPPIKFIKLAEEMGLIITIGKWVLKNACLFGKKLHSNIDDSILISVNISAVELMQSNFVDTVREVIAETGIKPSLLGIEITETVLIESFESSIKKIEDLCALGIEVFLDDFGTGYSSLNYLKKLPINSIKIDKTFVDDINENESDRNLVDVMVDMAHKLNLKVVAEGVETEEQFEILRQNRCDMIQGYLFSKPLPGEQVVEMIKKHNKNAGNTK